MSLIENMLVHIVEFYINGKLADYNAFSDKEDAKRYAEAITHNADTSIGINFTAYIKYATIGKRIKVHSTYLRFKNGEQEHL